MALLQEDFRRFFNGLFNAVIAHLKSLADQTGSDLHDYSCTLIVAILINRQGYFAQIGDGALVVEIEGEGFECETWPAQGEFINETVFVTTEGAIETAQIIREERKIAFFAAFTDGIQRLALHYASNSAHSPFFVNLKSTLSQMSHSNDALVTALGDFLHCEGVNQRTDDDKTLVIGTWVDGGASEPK
jgi:hypothetical protein